MRLEYFHSHSGLSYVEVQSFGSRAILAFVERLEDGSYQILFDGHSIQNIEHFCFDTEYDMLKFIRDSIEI